MHTLKIIFGGFLLLGISLFLGRWIGGATPAVTVNAIKCFLALWVILTLINMWIGVSKAGYSVKDELPVALVVLAVPAIVAIAIWWKAAATQH